MASDVSMLGHTITKSSQSLFAESQKETCSIRKKIKKNNICRKVRGHLADIALYISLFTLIRRTCKTKKSADNGGHLADIAFWKKKLVFGHPAVIAAWRLKASSTCDSSIKEMSIYRDTSDKEESCINTNCRSRRRTAALLSSAACKEAFCFKCIKLEVGFRGTEVFMMTLLPSRGRDDQPLQTTKRSWAMTKVASLHAPLPAQLPVMRRASRQFSHSSWAAHSSLHSSVKSKTADLNRCSWVISRANSFTPGISNSFLSIFWTLWAKERSYLARRLKISCENIFQILYTYIFLNVFQYFNTKKWR